MIDKLKSFLREDVKIEEVTKVIDAYSKELVKGIDPLAGITTKEDAWKFINSNGVLKSAHDTKVTEAITHYKENNFDKDYQERYNKEHPPEDEKDKKLRELESKLNQTHQLFEEQKKQAERELIKNHKITKMTELLGKESLKIVDIITGNTTDEIENNLQVFTDYINTIKKNSVEQIMRNESVNPGTGGGTPESVREKLIQQYNEAEKNGDVGAMFNISQQLNKKK